MVTFKDDATKVKLTRGRNGQMNGNILMAERWIIRSKPGTLFFLTIFYSVMHYSVCLRNSQAQFVILFLLESDSYFYIFL